MRALMKIGAGLLALAFVLIGITYSMLKAYGGTSPTSVAGRSLGGETRKTTLVNGNDKLDIELGGQHITMTMDQSVTAGLTITLMANVNITLQVGPSQIILTPAGIVINAPTIAMTAQAAMALTAGGPLAAHGLPTLVG